MKKIAIILFYLISSNVFAQDITAVPQSDGTALYFVNGNPEFYAAIIDLIDPAWIDIRNKVIYFITSDVHEFDDFAYRFNSIFAKEIIARDWFRRQDFQTEELYNICRELRERAGSVFRLNYNLHIVTVVANDRYGYFARFMFNSDTAISRHFFELKEN